MTTPSRRHRRAAAALLGLALVIAGCGRTGSATTHIDEAETELAGIVESIVDELSFAATSEDPFGDRVTCEQRGLGAGASNSASLRGPVPAVDDPIGRSAAVLLESGYELIESDIGEGIFGRRDGIRVTVVIDEPLDELAIDVATGCRPLPT